MPVAKLCTSGSLNAMKSEDGNDSLDTFIRQAIGKEPLLPFSRTGDNPVQWIQLLHALDQPDLPGWPLMTPIKIQMHKCEKCTREFCSPINYRRHTRVHRRSLNVYKESHKSRDLLAAFWDKLSLEEAKEVVSFNNTMLKEIPGSSIIRALASSLHKPGVWTLPQVYVKAGSALLDIIQTKPSSLPMSSQELFSILDDASERTFLCGGTAEAVQKYVFDGEAAKNSLELKNLVACTSFLFEQQLVKAWVADKDAEALRCQKLLVEEEEAAQKRQAELLERKKLKKLRQKEQKAKEQFYGCKGGLAVNDDAVDGPVLAEASGPSSPSESNSNSVDVPANLDSGLEAVQFQSKESEKDIESQIDFSNECINQGNSQSIVLQTVGENGLQHIATNRWQEADSKPQRSNQYGSHQSQTLQSESVRKISPSKDRILLNGNKVWTKKNKSDSDEERLKPSLQGEIIDQKDGNNCKVVIGSISITVNGCDAEQQNCYPDDAQDTCSTERAMLEKNTVQSGTDSLASKLWRPVSRGETKGIPPVERRSRNSEEAVVLERVHDLITSSERCAPTQSPDDDYSNALQGNVSFSSIAAKEFLAQRWKEAISTDHVKLVLSSGHGPPDVQHDNSTASNASDQLGTSAQAKYRKKPEKSLKNQYMPKPKAAA